MIKLRLTIRPTDLYTMLFGNKKRHACDIEVPDDKNFIKNAMNEAYDFAKKQGFKKNQCDYYIREA